MSSTVVGTAVYEVKIDSGKLVVELKSADDAVTRFGNNADNSTKKADKAFNDLATGSIVAIAAAAAAAGAAIVTHIGDAVKRVDTLNNFPNVMQNLGYGSNEASAAIDKLDKGVRGLPTSLDQIASAMQNIAPSATSLDAATKITLALNDALVAGGKDAGLQASAMEQFSQAIAKGNPDMVEWRSIAEAMPGQLQQISQSLGYEQWQQMADAVTKGKLSFNDVTQALVDLDTKGFSQFPSFAEQAKNATGGIQTSFANMNTAITRGIASIETSIGTNTISSSLTNVGAAFEGVLNIIAGFVTFIRSNPIFLPLTSGLAAATAAFVVLIGVTFAATKAMIAFRAALTVISKHPIIAALSVLAGIVASIATASGFDELQANLDDAAKSAEDANNSVQDIPGNLLKASGASNQFSKQLAKIEEQSRKINEDYIYSLAQLVAQKNESIDTLKKTLADEEKAYQDSYNKRLATFQKTQGDEKKAHDDKTKSLQNQIDFLRKYNNASNQQQLAELQFSLDQENAQYQAATQLRQNEFDAETQAAVTEYEKRRQENQNKLDSELALLQKHRDDVLSVRNVMLLDEIDALKKQRDEQLKSLQQQRDDIINNLSSSYSAAGTKSADAFAQALKDGLIYYGAPNTIEWKQNGKKFFSSGFASGGFTGRGAVNEPAGVVHKGEYVLPQEMVDQSTGLPKPSVFDEFNTGNNGNHFNITIPVTGAIVSSPQDQRKFAEVIGKRLNEIMVQKGFVPSIRGV